MCFTLTLHLRCPKCFTVSTYYDVIGNATQISTDCCNTRYRLYITRNNIKLGHEITDLRIGFTGRRDGLSDNQLRDMYQEFHKLCADYNIIQLEHGDCVGADTEFHEMCSKFNRDDLISIRPCNQSELRSFSKANKIYPVKTAFARNRDIVDNCDLLLACPAYIPEGFDPKHPKVMKNTSGGTWYTINYALKKGVKVTIIN